MMPGPLPAVRPATPDPQSPSASASPGAASTADVQAAPPAAPFSVGLDSSSPEAFIRSIAPYAARVSKATGIPAEALIGMAANETGYGKYASHNNLFGIKGTGPAGTFSTPTWEDYGNGPVTITDNFRAYHSPAESFMDFADLVTTSPRYKGAVGQTTVEGFVNGLRQGGYMTDPDYVAKISAITTRYSSVIQQSLQASSASGVVVASVPASVASPARPSAGVTVPDQFGIGLAPSEAVAACGPVAAIAFAQVYGRNPTPAEAMELAKQSGWTPEGGMNGIANEKRLLDKMGLPAQLEMGANWDHIRAEAMQRQPVILSTPGHYLVIDGYDPNTGAYHVGQSGKVYRGGSEWMTPGQIEALAGAPSGALYTVHPLAGQRQVLPPLQPPAGQRQVLPPLDLGNTPPPPPIPPPLPPPAPPRVAPPPPPPVVAVRQPPQPPPVAVSAAPQPPPVAAPSPEPEPEPQPQPDPVPVSIHDVPPPTLASWGPSGPPHSPLNPTPTPPAPSPIHDVPPEPLARGYAEAPTISMPLPDETPPPQPVQPSPDVARPGIPPGLAVGAVAASNQRQPPPSPPRPRRPGEDDLQTHG